MTDEIPRLPNGLLKALSPRQADVARLAAWGMGTTEIANALGISYEAAKMHINRIADLLPNPRLLPPLRLVTIWATAQKSLRQEREPDVEPDIPDS